MMHKARFLVVAAMAGALMLGAVTAHADHHTAKLSGTRFEMQVPKDWAPGYKDLDDRLLMIYFQNADGATLEGVYLRKVQPATFSLGDFKKFRVDAENKRYDGKDHKVAKDETITIGGTQGNYLMTTWADGGKAFEKHTAQYLKDGRQYMVVLHGPQGKVNKKVFDDAVASFALGKE
jgi:hypothetical protein